MKIEAQKVHIEGSLLVIGELKLENPTKITPETVERLKSRVVVCGEPGSGKSSIVGCLVKNLRQDNGSGLARSLVLQFPHEVLSGGVTSSITKHLFRDSLELVDVPGRGEWGISFFCSYLMMFYG